MSDSLILEELGKCELFRGIAEEHLNGLAAICRETEFRAHSIIFEEYQPADDVYVILSGEISLAICKPEDACRHIADVRQGEMMGWSPLVGRTRLFDTAMAVTPVKALLFDGQKLLDFCKANPEFGFEFMRRVATVLAERLSGTRLQLLEMSGVHLPRFPLESD